MITILAPLFFHAAHIHGTEKRVCAKFVPPLPDAFDKLIVGHFRSIIVIDSADAIDNVLPNNSVNVKQVRLVLLFVIFVIVQFSLDFI